MESWNEMQWFERLDGNEIINRLRKKMLSTF